MASIKRVLLTTAAIAMTATTASAGGYDRGSADLSALLGDGSGFVSSIAIVAPTRRITAINGAATTGGARANFGKVYATIGGTATAKFNDNFRCAGSYAQPFGADANYGTAQLLAGVSSTTASTLSAHELGATCSAGYKIGRGQAFVLGGAFLQSVSYNEVKGFINPGTGVFTNNVASLTARDNGFGFRAGVGYAIPDIAFKASLMYRSAVRHNVTGTQTIGAVAAAASAGLAVANGTVPAPFSGLPAAAQAGALAAALTGDYNISAAVTTPQSIKLSVQTGVAAGTLVFGSVKWTDWSVLQRVAVVSAGGGTSTIAGGLAVGAATPGAPSINAFFRDGFTLNAGVARQFNDKFSGLVSYTWDRGTGTGRSDSATTNTFSLGANYKFDDNVSIRAGAAYTLIGASTYTTTGLTGAALTVTNGASRAIGGGLSLNIKF